MLLGNQKSCITGSKKAISTKVCRNFKASTKETGLQRKLSVKEELTLILLQLRTAMKFSLKFRLSLGWTIKIITLLNSLLELHQVV